MMTLEFDDDELRVAMEWHGGMRSMLYAVASTGTLRIGTRRPDPAMTDAEWLQDLAWRLSTEAERCAEEAEERSPEDVEHLLSIARKADHLAESLEGE